MKPRRRYPSNRAGYALVLFVMMFFGLMGFAALVIDMGFVRLTQRQMQTAVDSAALEGVRFRSDCPDDWLNDPAHGGPAPSRPTTPYNKVDPQWQQWLTWLDGARRETASQMLANVFDDDLDTTNRDPHQFGAGPIVAFDGGIGPPELAASQTTILSDSPVYKPRRADGTPGVELNQSNASEGDMVAGMYNPGYPSDEADDYARADFTCSGTDSSANNAFLVRMRRTSDAASLDNQPGVSSGGPTLPFLFGRGSLMARNGSSGQLSVASGVTVRATAIAAAGDSTQLDGTSYSTGRVKAAGPPYQYADPNTGNQISIPGITPFALTWNFWENGAWISDGENSPQTHSTLQVASNGAMTAVGDAALLGQIMEPVLTEIGRQVVVAGKAAPLTDAAANSTLYRYVPIYESIGIIGFGYVRWTWDASSGILTLTKGSAGTRPVGYGNCSGVLVLGLPRDGNGNVTVDVAQLFATHAAFSNPLYSPVLVNRYIGPTH